MKKAKKRKRTLRLSQRRVTYYASFFDECKRMNSARTELCFKRDERVLMKVIFWDAGHCAIIQCHNRYFTLSYRGHSHYARPFTMTLAQLKQLNDNLA